MTSKEFEFIKEMLKKQSKLDESIMSAYGLEEIDEEKLNMAILDEIGELTHELKANWCWWKKTQAPVDNEKVLDQIQYNVEMFEHEQTMVFQMPTDNEVDEV